MDGFKKFVSEYAGAIIGAIVALVILLTHLYELIVGIILIIIGMFIGNYVQRNGARFCVLSVFLGKYKKAQTLEYVQVKIRR